MSQQLSTSTYQPRYGSSTSSGYRSGRSPSPSSRRYTPPSTSTYQSTRSSSPPRTSTYQSTRSSSPSRSQSSSRVVDIIVGNRIYENMDMDRAIQQIAQDVAARINGGRLVHQAGNVYRLENGLTGTLVRRGDSQQSRSRSRSRSPSPSR